MRVLVCFPLYLISALLAQETQDSAAIDKVISALNDPAQRSVLFTTNAHSAVNFERLIELHRQPSSTRVLIGMNEPWPELTVPRVVSGSIRYIKRDVAIVDGASTIDGAVTLARRVPLLFVMKQESGAWRIDVVRVGVEQPSHAERTP